MTEQSNGDPQLTDYIKNGAYFKDAREWYALQYIAPFTQRTWLTILCIVSCLFLSLAVYNIFHILPLEEKVPYILQVEDADMQSASISPLTQKEEDAWVAIGIYLVKEYVTLRESYRFSEFRGQKLTEKKQRVRKTSSKNVYQEYLSLLNDSNPRSPVRLYRNESIRIVKFKDVSFTRLDETRAKVDITFTATVNNLKSNKKSSSDWKAEIYFQLPAIDPEAQKGVSLSFLVTSYKVTSEQ